MFFNFFFPHRLVILQYRRIRLVSVSTFYFLMYKIIFLTRFIHRFCFVVFFLSVFWIVIGLPFTYGLLRTFVTLSFRTILYLSEITSNFLSFFLPFSELLCRPFPHFHATSLWTALSIFPRFYWYLFALCSFSAFYSFQQHLCEFVPSIASLCLSAFSFYLLLG